MSKFTGKEVCVYSEFFAFGDEDKTDWSKQIIRIYNPKTKEDDLLTIKETKDIVPYFAHMVGISSGEYKTDENGKYHIKSICISATPYYVTEEKRMLSLLYDDIRKYFHSCKRKKSALGNSIKPTFGDFLNRTYIWWDKESKNRETAIEIFQRLEEHPYAKESRILKGLRYYGKMQEYYKKELYNEMIKYGYTENEAHEWVYEHWYKE